MWNRRWLLYVIVLGVAARRTSSMNEQPRGKSNSPKAKGSGVSVALANTDSESKEKPRDDSSVKSEDHEALLPSTSLNRTVAGLDVPGAGSSVNDTTKLQNPQHEQSHSKRHFRRSRVFHKEGRTKVHSSLNKNNSTRSSLSPPGTPVAVTSQEIFRNFNHNNDSTKLKLPESTSRAPSTGPSKTRDDFISQSGNSSTASLIVNNGSKDGALGWKLEELSSKTSDNSGWTDDWGNSSSSSSSETASVVDEKTSSVELMSFTFDTVEGGQRSTSPTGTATHSSSPTTITTAAQVSERSIDTQKSSLLDSAKSDEKIDRGQSVRNDDDLGIYSVHSEKNSRDAATNEVSTSVGAANDSVTLLSPASAYHASKNAKNTGSTASADLERSTGEVSHSSGSADASFDRVSLAKIFDALKNAGSEGFRHRGSYSYTDSEQLSGSSEPSVDEISLAKRSRSLTNPEEIHDPIAPSSEEIDGPLKLTVPLIFGTVESDREASNSLSVLKNAAYVPDKIGRDSKLALEFHAASSGCLSNSSIERSRRREPLDAEDSLDLRRGSDATLSILEKSISDSIKSDLCSTRSFPGNEARNSSHESSSAERSNEGYKNIRSASPSTTDDNRGAQIFPYTDGAILLPEINEPVIRESLSSDSAEAGMMENEGTTMDADGTEDFFAGFADLEIEHGNTSSFDIFIPSLNSGEIVEEFGDSASRRELENLTSKPESIYILGGLRFFKNSGEDAAAAAEEEENELERRGAIPSDYGETESYARIEGLIPEPKIIDRIEFEAELPVKEEPLVADLRWQGNFDEGREDFWWPNDDGERRDDDTVRSTASNPRPESFASKEVREIKYPADYGDQGRTKDSSSYRIFLFPTVYALIGVCIVAVGCSIWWSNASSRRKRSLPKLKYFVHQRQEASRDAAV